MMSPMMDRNKLYSHRLLSRGRRLPRGPQISETEISREPTNTISL